MCSHDMFVETPEGKKLAYKPTGWMSNSIHILKQVAIKCTGGHEHARLTQGRAASAAVWPEGLCLAILRGLRKQLKHDGIMKDNVIGTICEDQEEARDMSYHEHMYTMQDTLMMYPAPNWTQS